MPLFDVIPFFFLTFKNMGCISMQNADCSALIKCTSAIPQCEKLKNLLSFEEKFREINSHYDSISRKMSVTEKCVNFHTVPMSSNVKLIRKTVFNEIETVFESKRKRNRQVI